MATMFCSAASFGQGGNVIIASGDGNIFVFVKGIKQNSIAETNVEITAIADTSLKFSVLFSDSNLDSIKGNVKVIPGKELTYKLTKNLGKWEFILISTEPIIGTTDRPIIPNPPTGGVEGTSTSTTKPDNNAIVSPSIAK